MSGSRPQHLQRRGGTYHLRVRVPDDLKLRVGLLEVRRSLHVHTLAEARFLALKYAARVLEVFQMVQVQSLTKEQIAVLISSRFADLMPKFDQGFVPRTNAPDWEIAEQRGLAQERIDDLNQQITCSGFGADIRFSAERILAEKGLVLAEQPESVQLDAMSAVARAKAERQRLFIFRLDERVLAYSPSDPLFQAAQSVVVELGNGAANGFSTAMAPPSDVTMGPTFGELVSTYLSSHKKGWAAKTYRTRVNQTAYFVEYLGADYRAAKITTDQVRELRDGLCRLRTNHHVGAGKSFQSRQTDDPAKRIGGKTADLYFDTCKAIFRWAKSEGYITSNTSDGMAYAIHAKPKVKGDEAPRRPFSAIELKAIFSAPIYSGFKSPGRPHHAGALIHSNGRYWIPIIAHFTGMRLGEIVQLQLADVHITDKIPYIDVTEKGGGSHGSGEEKFVKSDAGVRHVPLHPDLIKLGFGRFVARVTKQRKGKGRLFFEVGYGSDGMPSSTFSKWFGRFLEKLGLTDPALVFHSFRHGAEDALRNALQHQYVIDQIIGHEDGKVSSGYGIGLSLETKYSAVKAMKWDFDLLPLLRKHPPSGF